MSKTIKAYEFERFITRRESINQYGKLGFAVHKEKIYVQASSNEEAKEKIKPFNYKKHIKFKFTGFEWVNLDDNLLDKIIDCGTIKEEF